MTPLLCAWRVGGIESLGVEQQLGGALPSTISGWTLVL